MVECSCAIFSNVGEESTEFNREIILSLVPYDIHYNYVYHLSFHRGIDVQYLCLKQWICISNDAHHCGGNGSNHTIAINISFLFPIQSSLVKACYFATTLNQSCETYQETSKDYFGYTHIDANE